jgi:hypothetical protein
MDNGVLLHGIPARSYPRRFILRMKKILYSVPLVGLLFVGFCARAEPIRLQSATGQQSEPTTKSVAGKVTSIGNSGTSFAVEVEGTSKQTMQFVVNKNTQVQGQVKVGTLVAVDYQPAGNGQNLAVSIAVRG